MRNDNEQGQATPMMIGVVAVIVVLVVGVGWFGRSLADAARARTAADAAALAGVVDGRRAAERLAALNGGELTSFRQIGSDVVVTVRVGRASATARAALTDPGAYTDLAWPRSTDLRTRSTERRSAG